MRISFKQKGATVVLRPRRTRRLPWRPIGWGALALALLIFSGYAWLVNAESTELFPTSCLGNWENVLNALGKPQLALDAAGPEYNDQNSARFSGGQADIFCGNFSGEQLKSEPIRRMSLAFSWTWAPRNSASAGAPSLETPPSELPAETIPPVEPNASSSASWRVPFVASAHAQESAESSTILVVPFDLDSIKEEDPIPSEDAPEGIEIAVSVDGATWESLRYYELINWRREEVELPLFDPADLARLQIRVKASLRSPSAPIFYLDGMVLKVEYDSGTPSLFEPVAQVFTPKPSRQVPAEPPEVKIYDPEARHSCDIQPFSRTLRAGENVDFSLTLNKSAPDKLYTAQLGELPSGVHGFIEAGTSSTDSILHIRTDPEAPAGSFSLLVLYKEAQPDGSLLPNYCQYNVVIR